MKHSKRTIFCFVSIIMLVMLVSYSIFMHIKIIKIKEDIDETIFYNYLQLVSNLSQDTEQMTDSELLYYRETNMKHVYFNNTIFYLSSFFESTQRDDLKEITFLLYQIFLFQIDDLSSDKELVELMRSYYYQDNLINGELSQEIIQILSERYISSNNNLASP